MKLSKTAVKLFLVWATVFFMASWIQADELSAIKDGYNSYWSKIKDGKGSCTVIGQYFTTDNPEVPKYTSERKFEWMFADSKIRYGWKTPIKNGNQEAQLGLEPIDEVYFDGQKVTAGSWKNFVLRKLNVSDIDRTNRWDPRLKVADSWRSGESWEPVPFWQKGSSKIVGKEKVNGYECYILETAIDQHGVQGVRRNWFDIERNYCLVKNESWVFVAKDAVVSPGLEWTKDLGKYLSGRRDIELKKYGKDLWGPKKWEWVNYSPNPKTKNFYIRQKETTTYDDACAYNLGLTENDLKITIPSDATVFDASKYPTDYVRPKVSIEFRLVKNAPAPGFTETKTSDSNQDIYYIADKAELTEVDIKGVKVDFSMQGFPQFGILFTDEGAKKLAEATQNHLNERMAIFVDGKFLSIPLIRGKIPGGMLQIAGRFTEGEIKRIIGDEVK